MPGTVELSDDLAGATLEAEIARLESGQTPDFDADTPEVTEQQRIEAEATRKGWRPRDQYTGDPALYADASEFLARGDGITKNLQKEIAALRKQISSFEGTKAAFAKYHQETIAAKDKQLADTISELRIARSQATREGEDELAIELEDRIDALKGQRAELKDIPAEQEETSKPPKNAEPDLTDPLMQDWIESGNEWFRDDPRMRAYAVELGNQLIAEGETLRGRKFLDKVTDKMREEFPKRLGSKAQPTPRPGQVGSGSPAPVVSGRSERDLPPEDRKLMLEFIQQGLTTKEAFLKSYFS